MHGTGIKQKLERWTWVYTSNIWYPIQVVEWVNAVQHPAGGNKGERRVGTAYGTTRLSRRPLEEPGATLILEDDVEGMDDTRDVTEDGQKHVD
jgi:hypothetical protein